MVLGVILGCVHAKTREQDIIALKMIREEVRGRDVFWDGVIESWTGGGPNGEDDPCGDSWEGNWLGVECRFQGDLPPDEPRSVTNIHIPDRKLGGPVPLGIALLRDIIELDLDGNNLSGPMNPYLGCLKHIREFDLANNSLSGTVPTEWRFMTKLEEAELENNPGLYGCLPQGMPPTKTECSERMTTNGFVQPVCELVGTIVTDTGIQGFCPTIPNIDKRCPDVAFVQKFIDDGRNYDLYFQSQADSSMPGQIPVSSVPLTQQVPAAPVPAPVAAPVFTPQVVPQFAPPAFAPAPPVVFFG